MHGYGHIKYSFSGYPWSPNKTKGIGIFVFGSGRLGGTLKEFVSR